jgi:hypothetical protein
MRPLLCFTVEIFARWQHWKAATLNAPTFCFMPPQNSTNSTLELNIPGDMEIYGEKSLVVLMLITNMSK